MKIPSIVRTPLLPTIPAAKPLPIVAVAVDCLILSVAIFYFTGQHNKHPSVSKPSHPTAKVASTVSQSRPKVLGSSTATNTTGTSPAEQPDIVTVITQQTSTTTPLITTTVIDPPTVSQPVPVPVPPPVDTPPRPTIPSETAPPATVPAPDPATPDFTTAIISAGRVLPGTLIGLNSAKGEKTYYGGDLVLSATTVTISRASFTLATAPTVTIASPDGAMVNMPSSLGGLPSLSMDAALATSSGTTFPMLVDIGTTPTNGTYAVHIVTHRSSAIGDAWQYDGFLTVVITD